MLIVNFFSSKVRANKTANDNGNNSIKSFKPEDCKELTCPNKPETELSRMNNDEIPEMLLSEI